MMEGVVGTVGWAGVAVVTGVTVMGGCELETTGDAGWLGEELADVGEMMIVDSGTAGAVGMAEVAEAAGTTEEEGVDEVAGMVDVDGLGGAERAAKSSGPGAG